MQKQIAPLLSRTGQNYRLIYRAVCDFHEKHNNAAYKDWDTIHAEMQSLSNRFDSPFADALLLSVFEELEREEVMEQDFRHASDN